jgi:hypothetical protein
MNLTIERQLSSDLLLSVSYVGKLSQKLEGHRHWNPAVFGPDPLNGQAPSAQNVNDRVLYLFRETSGVGDFVGSSLHKLPTPMNEREVERMLGRDKEALRHFQEVLDLKPNHAEAASEVRAVACLSAAVADPP